MIIIIIIITFHLYGAICATSEAPWFSVYSEEMCLQLMLEELKCWLRERRIGTGPSRGQARHRRSLGRGSRGDVLLDNAQMAFR